MKIGIDIRPLQGDTQFRGIGKSLEFFLEALPKLLLDDEVIFYVDAGLKTPAILSLFPNAKVVPIKSSPLGRARYIRSVLPSYRPLHVRKQDVDVVLQYDAALGIPANVPTITIFHDLIPYLFRGQERQLKAKGMRQIKNSLARNLYWQKYLRVLTSYKRSSHIIAISEASKKDLLTYIKGVKKHTVRVIPHGVRPLNQKLEKPSVAMQKLAKNPFLLYVGGIDYRKNIVGLLQAFFEVKLSHPDLKLVTVGKEFGLSDQLSDLGWNGLMQKHPDFAKDVVVPGFLSEGDLVYLYQHAKAFVFPSRYEGFGMPVLEAMQVGCPVIAYDNSSIPEVAGNAALMVPDGKPLAPVIEKLLNSKTLQEKLSKQGKERVKLFAWEYTAERIVAVLRSAAK